MSYGYIYRTTNLLENKVYIGRRYGNFISKYFGSGIYLRRAIQKYGKENFKVELIAYAKSKKELNDLEIFYIAENRKLLGRENMYNISTGGEGMGSGEDHPDYSGNKNPMYGKKGKDAPMFGRTGIKSPMFGRVGEQAPMYNKHHTKETKKKISISMHKVMCTPKAREKVRQANLGSNNHNYGKKLPKHSLDMIGENNPMFGVHLSHSIESREKMRLSYKNHKQDCMCASCKSKRGIKNAQHKQ